MRIDLEQFLALTVALGTAGAVGVAVYASQARMDQIAAEAPASIEDVEREAEPEPEPTAAPIVVPTLPAEPSEPPLPPGTEEDESVTGDGGGGAAPGPDTEGAWM